MSPPVPQPNHTTHPTGRSGDKPDGHTVRLGLRFVGDHENDEFQQLCEILRNAGATRVHRPLLADPTPGYRGADGKIADAVATLEPTVSMVGQVVAALRDWLGARPQSVMELTIGQNLVKINGLSSVDEDRLVEAFVRRAAGASTDHG